MNMANHNDLCFVQVIFMNGSGKIIVCVSNHKLVLEKEK